MIKKMSRNRRMNNPLQLNTFQVLLNTGQFINEPIEHLRELDEIIRIYGLEIIAKITFYFHNHQRLFYNLILRNSEQDNRFVVEFYHYYNHTMERVEISQEEKIRDFTTVMDCINRTRNLSRRFTPFIINPLY